MLPKYYVIMLFLIFTMFHNISLNHMYACIYSMSYVMLFVSKSLSLSFSLSLSLSLSLFGYDVIKQCGTFKNTLFNSKKSHLKVRRLELVDTGHFTTSLPPNISILCVTENKNCLVDLTTIWLYRLYV